MILVISMATNKYNKFYNKLINIPSVKNTNIKIISKNSDLLTIDFTNITGIIITGSPLSVISINNRIYKKIQKILIPLLLTDVPVLGICFGYGCINSFLGGDLIKMKQSEHLIKEINLKENILFKGFENKILNVGLYHSDEIYNLSSLLTPIAYDLEGKLMGFTDNKRYYGVQFHPEAFVETHFVVDNFLEICNKNLNVL